MRDSQRLFTKAGVLILMGALVAGAFRVISPSGYDPTTLVLSFSKNSQLNTPDQYRFNNHGRIIAIQKDLYDKTAPWAYATLAVQSLFWLPAILMIAVLGMNKSRLSWTGLILGVLGLVIWIVTQVSSPV